MGSSTASSSHGSPDGAFSTRQVAALFQLTESQLRYWSRTGFIVPSIRQGTRAFYSFRDLVAVKVAKGLLDRGIGLRRVRRSLTALARDLPPGEANLANLRVRCEGDQVIVERSGHLFESTTGQLVLDFDVDTLKQEAATVVELSQLAGRGEGHRIGDGDADDTAYDWFLRGCELEDEWGGAPADREGFEHAKFAYERALELDCELAAAWTNLGSMYAELGDFDEARTRFERALGVDPDQPEALCNLAELALREDDVGQAVELYRQVVEVSPDAYEGHYGLARAFLARGEQGKFQALAHLERFCSVIDAILGQGDSDPELLERKQRAEAVVGQLRDELKTPS